MTPLHVYVCISYGPFSLSLEESSSPSSRPRSVNAHNLYAQSTFLSSSSNSPEVTLVGDVSSAKALAWSPPALQ